MLFNAENILLIGSVLLFVSIVVSKTGYRFGVPTLLVFLLVGMFLTDWDCSSTMPVKRNSLAWWH